MGKDIAAVMTKTKEIVAETQGTPNAPYNYILVTFNDPGTYNTYSTCVHTRLQDPIFSVSNVHKPPTCLPAAKL